MLPDGRDTLDGMLATARRGVSKTRIPPSLHFLLYTLLEYTDIL